MREVPADLIRWSQTRLLKVCNVQTFIRGRWPIERMLLDLRDAAQPLNRSVAHLPWPGVLVNDVLDAPERVPAIVVPRDADLAVDDAIEVDPHRRRVSVRYRRGDQGNVLFATERCNNLCLMCSQPPREIDDSWREQSMCDLADLIDVDEPSLGITGGEPTLLGLGLLRVVQHCLQVLPDTQLHILSNGRRFSESEYAAKFRDVQSHVTWGIPLYGDHARLHDYVVQAEGAFAETMRGLYALHEAGQRIEIRVVLVKPTFERLPELARYIQRNLPFVSHVALMGVEPVGFAKAHPELLWMDPADAASALVDAVANLAGYGLRVSIYNLPLCVLPRELWPYAQRSISTWKQTYLPSCDACAVRSKCAGVFQWIIPAWTSRSIAPISEEVAYA